MCIPYTSSGSHHSSSDHSSHDGKSHDSDPTKELQKLRVMRSADDSPMPSIEAGLAVHGEADDLADHLAHLNAGPNNTDYNTRLSAHKPNGDESININNFMTARGLYNATPRPSPSPVPESSPGSSLSSDSEGVPDSPSERSAYRRPKGTENIGDGLDAQIRFHLEHLNLGEEQHPYRVKDEKFPPGPYFQPDFQNALKEGIKLAGTVTDNIAHYNLAHEDGSSLKTILETAKNLRQFKSPISRTIGIVGSSGAGGLDPHLEARIWVS